MLTIKIFLSDSGRSASVDKSFPLFQGQWQDKLLNVYVPTAILQQPLTTVNYIGQTSDSENPADPADEDNLNTILDGYVLLQTRNPADVGDYVYYIYRHDGTDAYYVCTKTDEAWNYEAVDAFPPIVSGAAAVSVGSIATKRNGQIVKSQPYYMRYLKPCVVNGVEYALYERRLPSAFTAYDGVSANAPEIVVNVTNMQDGEIVSIITSQKVYLDVLPSTVLDAEPPADPSEFEELVGRVSEIEAEMLTKQNQAIPGAYTNDKTVEGAINELHGQTARNTADVSSLDDRMDKVETAITTGENYVGVYSASSLPTDSDLEEFVDEKVGRDPQEGDVVIVILEISGDNDKSYKYIYSSLANNGLGGWIYYEVPPLSPASNLSLGLIKGTYTGSIGSDLVYVDIVDGEIKNIYAVVTVGGSQSLVRLDVTAQRVENIISGAQTVGNAARAVADASGNNIVNTYLTKTAGATKQFVRDYALPRTFNDVHYLNVDGGTASYDKTLDPTSDYADVEAAAIGDFDLFTATYTLGDETFQLGAQNIYSAKFFVSANTDESVQLRLTTSIKPTADAAPITASVELTGVVALTSGSFVQFNNNLSSLTGVVTMEQGGSITQTLTVVRTVSYANTFKVYSNSTYPSTLYLQTACCVNYYEAAEKGQIEFVSCGTPALDSGNAVSVCTLPLGVSLVDEAEYFFEIPAASFADNTPVMVEFDGTQYPIFMPYGNATAKDMAQTYFVGGDWWVFVGVFVGVGFVAETPNLNGKADKVAGATAGNLAEIDATGNLAGSGVPASNVAQQDGSYDLFTAGLAKNFQGRANTAVSANFTFREAGGSADIGNPQATIKSIHGNTIIDDGALLNFNGTGLKTVGFNAYNDGEAFVLGGKQYQITGNYSSLTMNGATITPNSSGIFTPSADGTLTVTGGGDNTCIHLVNTGYRNGEYEPYWTSTLPLPVATYFPTGMKSAGSVYDELTEKKAVTRIGSVDLSTLTWTFDTTYGYFETTQVTGMALPPDASTKGNIVSAKYENRLPSGFSSTPPNGMVLTFTGYLRIKTTGQSDRPTGTLYYELETPTETDVDLNFTYKVDDYGTEQILSESDTSPFVGTIHYAMNAVDKLNRLPDVPSTTGYYTVYYNASTGLCSFVAAEGSGVYQHDISMKNSSDEWLYFTCVNKNPTVTYDNDTNKLTGVPDGTYAARTLDYGAGVVVVLGGSVTFYYGTSSKAWDGGSGVTDTATKIY